MLWWCVRSGAGEPRCSPYHTTLVTTQVNTPNMDKIAEEGVRFTHMHSAASLCAPSRYSILTGNLPMRGSMPNGEWALRNPLQLTTGQRTTAHLFRDAGYKTGYVGKVHLGGGLVDTKGGSMKECLENTKAACRVLVDTDGGSMQECLAKTSAACQVDWMQGIQQCSMLKSVAHPCLLALGYVVSSEGKERLSLGFYRRLLLLAVLYKALLSPALHNASAIVCKCPLYTQSLRKAGVCAAGTIYTI